MEEKSRSQLETQWRSIDPQYSYSDWEAKRRDDWQRIISQRLPELGKSIAVDSGLFTYLQSKAVFDRRTIETFKQEDGTYAQVSSVLHALDKQSFAGFVAFCECLIETEQTAIIVDLFTPELHELRRQQQQQQPLLNVDVRRVAGEDMASLQVLGVVDLRPAEDSEDQQAERATIPAASATVVDYDWKSLIRQNFMQLRQHIDPDSGLLNELQSRGVICHVSADVIKSKKGRVNRVGAILDHVTQFRPEADFVRLCEALEATNQRHVVDRYLSKDSVQAPDQGSLSAEDLSRATVTKKGNVVDTWRTVLIQNRSAIIELLHSSDDFIDRLVTYRVMNFATGEMCREEPDEVARSQFILDHMHRRSSVDMENFCRALDDTAQQHIVREFFQKLTNVDSSTAANEPTNAYI